MLVCSSSYFFFKCNVDHQDRHVLTHSFPTRRSSDLPGTPNTSVARPSGRRRKSVLRSTLCTEACGSSVVLGFQTPRRIATCSPRSVQRWKRAPNRSEEHTSELQSLMRISYAVFCLQKKNTSGQHQ